MPRNQAERNAALVRRFLSYRETQGAPRATIINFRVYLTKWLAWAGDRSLDALTLDDLETFAADEYGHLGYSSKKQVIVALRAFYRWAVKRGHVPLNVAVELELPRKPRRQRPTFYQPEQVAAILREIPDHGDRLIATLLARHGQRISSCLSLRWRDVDFDKAIVRYPGVKAMKVDSMPLSLDKDSATLLKAWKALQRNTGPDDYVFESKQRAGHARCDDNFRAVLALACKRAGVPYRGAHELRRTAITTLIQMGVPLHVVSRSVAGHSHISTTVDHYAGDDDDSVADAIARLPY